MVWVGLLQSPLVLAATLVLERLTDTEPLVLVAGRHPLKMIKRAR